MLAGVNANDLEALLEFVYRGEVSVDHSQLPSLLQAAHCLNIQGLAPQTVSHKDDQYQIQLHPTIVPQHIKTVIDVGNNACVSIGSRGEYIDIIWVGLCRACPSNTHSPLPPEVGTANHDNSVSRRNGPGPNSWRNQPWSDPRRCYQGCHKPSFAHEEAEATHPKAINRKWWVSLFSFALLLPFLLNNLALDLAGVVYSKIIWFLEINI